MRLVDDEQEVLREVVEQTVRRAARSAAVDMSGVVLDAGAGADLPHHLDVVAGPHPQPLSLQHLLLPLQLPQPLPQLHLDAGDGPLHPRGTGDVVAGREQVDLLVLGHHLTGQRVQRAEFLDLVAEELDPHGELLIHREHLEGVAAHPERPAAAGEVVPRVLDADQPPQQGVPLDLLADAELDHPGDVLLRGAQAVDRGHGGHHDHVPPGQQGVGGRVPESLDLLVEGGVLLDVGVGLRNVRLGLVVVVVGDEVLHRVLREELPQLVGELGGQRLVGLHDQDRPLHAARPARRPSPSCRCRSRRAARRPARRPGPGVELLDGRRLITGRREVALDPERGDSALQILESDACLRAYVRALTVCFLLALATRLETLSALLASGAVAAKERLARSLRASSRAGASLRDARRG